MYKQKKNPDTSTLLTAANDGKKRHKLLEHWKIIAFYLFMYDIFAINFSYFLGLWMRFDFYFSNIPREYLDAFLKFAPFYTIFSLIQSLYLKQ